MHKFMLRVVVVSLLLTFTSAATNYIRNGDFQKYSASAHRFVAGAENFTYSFCFAGWWYIESYPAVKKFEVRTKTNMSKMVNLIPKVPQFICQKVNVKKIGAYKLSFIYLIDLNIVESMLIVKINKIIEDSITVTSRSPQIYQKIMNMTIGLQEICIGGSNPPNPVNPTIGVLIDNVSFSAVNAIVSQIEIEPQFYPGTDDLFIFTNLTSNMTLPLNWNLTAVFPQIKVEIDYYEIPQNQYEAYMNSSGHFTIKIDTSNMNQSISLALATIALPDFQALNFSNIVYVFNFPSREIVTFIDIEYRIEFNISANLLEVNGTTDLKMESDWNTTLTPQLITILVNGINKTVNLTIASDVKNCMMIQFYLTSPLQKSSVIEMQIKNKTLLNDKREFVSFYAISNTVFQQPTPIGSVLFVNLKQLSDKYIEAAGNSKGFIGAIGSNYMISNVIAFFSLTFLFNFLPYRSPLQYYKSILNQPMQKNLALSMLSDQINQYEPWRQIIVKDQIQDEKLPTEKVRFPVSLLQCGFTSRFWSNTEENILSLFLFMLKIAIVRLICLIPIYFIRICFGKIKAMWKELLLFEVITASPSIVLPFSTIASFRSNMGAHFIFDHINVMAFVLMGFLCFVSSFLLWVIDFSRNINLQSVSLQNVSVQNVSAQNSQKQDDVCLKNNLKTQMESNQCSMSKNFKKCSIEFLQNFLYFLLPMAAGQFSTIFYTATATLTIALRLFLLIKWKACFAKWEYGKKIVNRIIWVMYCAIYIFYLSLDIFQISSTDLIAHRFLIILGTGEIFLFLIGITTQVLITIIEAFRSIIEFLSILKKKYCVSSITSYSQEKASKSQKAPKNTSPTSKINMEYDQSAEESNQQKQNRGKSKPFFSQFKIIIVRTEKNVGIENVD